MARLSKRAARAAERWGLLTPAQAEAVGLGKRERLTCVACGGTFRQHQECISFFCCACCATAWGRIKAEPGRRLMRSGDHVVRVADGAVGTLVRIPTAETATLRVEGEMAVEVTPQAVERVQGLTVTHVNGCRREAGRLAGLRGVQRREAAAEEGDDGEG